ncbi:DNA cytosine methyltransferase [Agrococcus lahaulensis]|uniref:DNA cytosine methyltransferase n=1 Tax=Agrococcus lahaulensis TaxID=341722 RepID=UPI001B7F7A6C|nr:DNA cytosine methyltransferase [Agrococcus lahaulensis]
MQHNPALASPSIRPRPDNDAGNEPPLRALSFFSGAMGLDQGLEIAGLHTLLACENDRASRATIAANRPDIPILEDINKYSASDVRAAAGLTSDEPIDVVAGGPPCQAFSTAGARRGFSDDRGNVFLKFISLAAELDPEFVVIENVRGLLSMPAANAGSAGDRYNHRFGAIELVSDRLRDAGYEVTFNLYNAANFGVPQVRERVVLVAARGRRLPYLMPTHSNDPAFGLAPWQTLREAISDLRGRPHQHEEFPEKRLRFFRLLEEGQYWRHLPAELHAEAMGKSLMLGGGKTGFYRRLAWDKPSPTLVTSPTMPATDLGHPEDLRPLSVEEYRRIQQFPDSWHIEGKIRDKYRQLGNAVPVGLGQAIGDLIVRARRGEYMDPPAGFPFSRYKLTSDRDLLANSSPAART